MRYDRKNLNSTIRAAQIISTRSGLIYFVYATALGYCVYKEPPAFYQGYYAIDGQKVEPVNRSE